MDKDPTQRPCKHMMIPVLIENELDVTAPAPVTKEVAALLPTLIDVREDIPMDLAHELLRHGQILVIADHLSEMSENTRSLIQRGIRDVGAIIVTSRLHELPVSVAPTEIQPCHLTGSSLTSFMEGYLSSMGRDDLLGGGELHEVCHRVWNLAHPREITVFLARGYIDQMIRVEGRNGSLDDLPNNIPALIFGYVNELNETVPKESMKPSRVVLSAAGAVAWQCLRQSYRPEAARYRDVLRGISEVIQIEEEDARQYLEYIETRLCLVEISKPPEDEVRFLLDPLAEYLAGWHLVEAYAGADEKWRQFLEPSKFSGAWRDVSGFLLAVRDCCKAYGENWDVPTFVISQIEERITSS